MSRLIRLWMITQMVLLVVLFFADKSDTYRPMLASDKAGNVFLIVMVVNLILAVIAPIWILGRLMYERHQLLKEMDRESSN